MEPVNRKIYMVTGVTSALGKAIALGLAGTGATVLMVAKDDSHGAGVEREVAQASGNSNVELLLGDLSNLSSVRNLAEVINSKYEKIDVLIHNNSLYRKQRHVTVDGFEEMFAANYLGPFLLTNLLLDRLRASDAGRILILTGPTSVELDLEDLQGERSFNSWRAFQATRMANLLFTYELAQRLENSNITVNALHPGLVRSEILKEAPWLNRLFAWLFAVTPARAAQDIVQAAAGPGFDQVRGRFLYRGSDVQVPESALDPGIRHRLWEISERMTDASWRGPNYDPTGSVAMYNRRDLPKGLIRPEEDPTEKEDDGVVRRTET